MTDANKELIARVRAGYGGNLSDVLALADALESSERQLKAMREALKEQYRWLDAIWVTLTAIHVGYGKEELGEEESVETQAENGQDQCVNAQKAILKALATETATQGEPEKCPKCGKPICLNSSYDPVAGDCDGDHSHDAPPEPSQGEEVGKNQIKIQPSIWPESTECQHVEIKICGFPKDAHSQWTSLGHEFQLAPQVESGKCAYTWDFPARVFGKSCGFPKDDYSHREGGDHPLVPSPEPIGEAQ